MLKFNLIKKIIDKTMLLLLTLFIFKIFLLLFYLISGYQLFAVITIKIILRIILSIDILLMFFSLINIIKTFFEKGREKRITVIFLLFLNILFSMSTFFFAFVILVITD